MVRKASLIAAMVVATVLANAASASTTPSAPTTPVTAPSSLGDVNLFGGATSTKPAAKYAQAVGTTVTNTQAKSACDSGHTNLSGGKSVDCGQGQEGYGTTFNPAGVIAGLIFVGGVAFAVSRSSHHNVLVTPVSAP